MNTLEQSIINKALGQNSLPVMARMGHDPGKDYFCELITDLQNLCEALKETPVLSKELAYALHCLGRCPYVEYSNAVNHGKTFRDDLFDPQIFELEMAVESVLTGEWSPYLL